MKWRVVVIGLLFVAGALLVLSGSGVISAGHGEKGLRVDLPASLDQFYPPKSPAPAYLLAMHELANAFSCTVGDVLEGDMEHAKANFERFKKSYKQTSAMIPEWQDRYPDVVVEQLQNSLNSGDPSKIMPAVDAVGGTCHSCHLATMVPVQQKFRWNSFGSIGLTDPLSGQDVNFAGLMLMMETNFESIANDLQQGQIDNARLQFEGFNLRFRTIGETCATCHDSERLHYVSSDINDMISSLRESLNNPNPDMETIGKLVQSIGQESCSKCHLVHIPAAYSRI